MEIEILAIGKLKSGPEKQLIEDYLERFSKVSRQLGFSKIELKELDARKFNNSHEEGRALCAALNQRFSAIVMDERGDQLSSTELADVLCKYQRSGTAGVSFMIGGADGLSPEVRNAADRSLSLGKMVWPHMLARVLLCEQLYRTSQILLGTPYHRS